MYKIIKRCFDFAAALLAIIVLLPFMIPIIIGLLLTGEHYVFYWQERIGRGGKPFNVWKFATMLKNSPNIGTGTTTIANDPRVLPMGKFLRKTKINELPQLINVLIGNMSVIGPRPLVKSEFDIYDPETQQILVAMKPGLSGIGSVVFRDEEYYISQTSDPIDFYAARVIPQKARLEKWYYTHRNLWVDLMLILITVWVILFPKSNLVYKIFKDLPVVDLQKEADQYKQNKGK